MRGMDSQKTSFEKLSPVIFLDLGKQCSQFVCVSSFIISKLPYSSTSEIVCLVFLCLNENFRSAPKLNEAIVLFGSNDSSSSLCHPEEDAKKRYWCKSGFRNPIQ